ncbi:hypothetical protein Cni_G16771 [Canna indica]|uniref:DUF4283 domain-containing protein n=1 Tax=Canna indica TaxID=4628 RepID=A0AAQ3KFR5_9LILI|nr:hypothetical protein Cni_G16771 [Canna indica]
MAKDSLMGPWIQVHQKNTRYNNNNNNVRTGGGDYNAFKVLDNPTFEEGHRRKDKERTMVVNGGEKKLEYKSSGDLGDSGNPDPTLSPANLPRPKKPSDPDNSSAVRKSFDNPSTSNRSAPAVGDSRMNPTSGNLIAKSSYSSNDMEKVLSNDPWFLRGQVLLLIPWRENFQPMVERIDTIPIWVQFPGLPIEFLHRQILTELASVIGKPLKVDHITLQGNRAKFARGLIDLKYKGPHYTWCNNRLRNKRIMTRLDKYEEVQTLVNSSFNTASKKQNEQNVMDTFEDTLAELGKILTKWNKKNIGSLEERLNDSMKELSILEDIDDRGLSNELDQIQMRCLINRIMPYNRQIHIKWWSKARTLWIEQNDKNTKYFQNLVTFKKRKNVILEIETEGRMI